MAEQAPTYEMVEVKSEDLMPAREVTYAGFLRTATWSVGVSIVVLALMALFLV